MTPAFGCWSVGDSSSSHVFFCFQRSLLEPTRSQLVTLSSSFLSDLSTLSHAMSQPARQVIDLTYESDGEYEYPRPGPVCGDDVFLVDYIEEEKRTGGGVFYKVIWKGYPAEDYEWLHENEITDSSQLVAEWKQQQKKKNKSSH